MARTMVEDGYRVKPASVTCRARGKPARQSTRKPVESVR